MRMFQLDISGGMSQYSRKAVVFANVEFRSACRIEPEVRIGKPVSTVGNLNSSEGSTARVVLWNTR